MPLPHKTDSSAASRPISRAETGHDRAVRVIRGAILQGVLSPGQWLIEADLAEEFSLSRGSVRSALIEMTGEGLVERIQYRGARVRAVDRDAAVRITEVRMVIEGLLAAKAAVNATDAEIEGIAELVPAMRESVAVGDIRTFYDRANVVHRRIAEAARHDEALLIVRRLTGLSGVIHQFRLATLPGRVQASLEEHCSLAEAVVSRDPERAERAMRAHLRSVLAVLNQAPGPLHAVSGQSFLALFGSNVDRDGDGV